MEVGVQFQGLFHVQTQKLVLIIGMIVSLVVLIQVLVFPHRNLISSPPDAPKGSEIETVGNGTVLSSSNLANIDIVHRVFRNSMASDSKDKTGSETEKSEMEGMEKDNDFISDDEREMDNFLGLNEDGQHNDLSSRINLDLDKSLRNVVQMNNSTIKEVDMNNKEIDIPSVLGEDLNQSDIDLSPKISVNNISNLHADSRIPLSSIAGKTSLSEYTNNELLQTRSASQSNSSKVPSNSAMHKSRIKPTSISQMTYLFFQNSVSSKSTRPKLSSPRDRELQSARLQIENAPIIRSNQELDASSFRNFSMFKRSYELMEHKLKVYVYKEGEKPIFHQPHLRGIYASEGWFMKLMEGNKQFHARDPRKANLFYLPFSSQKLRIALRQDPYSTRKDLEIHLKNYMDIIAKKYHFWNRTGGADHFLVACHDWAPRMTRNNLGNCIRALCNANVARGFRIGKDVSLPVTNIRTSQDPQKDLGGNPPSERPFLAFFAGSMHGYLRPILLQYWENKEPDMKIFGPMPRDIEGKRKYQEYMKSSKYCICAKGYEVHTPRVVESIYHGCVPVIISDNYVPPFFEVLDWEAFSVFVSESDISNLRNILISIPEEEYLRMQERVEKVQQHFLWHNKPVKYDLFHMILHSVWYNRVFQSKL